MNTTLSATSTKPQIQIKKVVNHNIENVWSALTEKDALSQWLMTTDDFKLLKGHTFKFITKPQGGFNGIIECEVLDYSTPNFLSYSWQANGMKKPTIVTWEIKALSNTSTHITLSHTGFEGMKGWITKQILKFGWKSLVSKKLTQYLQS